MFNHSFIDLHKHECSHKCNTDILSRDITPKNINKNPSFRTHIQTGCGTEKKNLMENEWQVNGHKCCGMMKIMHGARETPQKSDKEKK